MCKLRARANFQGAIRALCGMSLIAIGRECRQVVHFKCWVPKVFFLQGKSRQNITIKWWLVLEVEIIFPCHMGIIQVHFGCWKGLERSRRLLGPLLNPILLDKQSFFPKLTLQNNYLIAMFPSHNYNLITWLWERFTSSRNVSRWLLKWLHQMELWTIDSLNGLNWWTYIRWWFLVAWRIKRLSPAFPSWITISKSPYYSLWFYCENVCSKLLFLWNLSIT